MAGQIPSFLSGSKLEIRIGTAQIAYAQNLAFTDDMQVQPVGGIGSYSYHALEPTGYLGRGSMTLTHYSDRVRNALLAAGGGANDTMLPGNLKATGVNQTEADGNSMLRAEYFSPVRLLTSQSFDIVVYERGVDPAAGVPTNGDLLKNTILYTLRNCRLATYNIGFTPGSMVNETVSFMCTSISDHRAEELNKDGEI